MINAQIVSLPANRELNISVIIIRMTRFWNPIRARIEIFLKLMFINLTTDLAGSVHPMIVSQVFLDFP